GSAESYLSQESLVRVMCEVLKLHVLHAVQTSKYEPAALPRREPEDIPTMKGLMAPRKPGNRCIHCHDVKAAEFLDTQKQGTFAKTAIFTYPLPSTVGLIMERDQQNIVREVRADSPSAKAGIRSSDKLVSADGQRITSVADFARVLELTPNQGDLSLVLQRGE